MGGGPSVPKPESTASILGAYTQYLPGLLSATSSQEPTTALNQLNSTMATQPLYNALNLQQAQQYAEPLAQVGQQVQNSNALAGGQTQLDQMLNTGGQTGMVADMIARLSNPNYYKIQDASSSQAANLVNSINLKGLSPGEQNSVERSLNQTNQGSGNLGLNNATNTVANAMNFGDRYDQKLGMMGSALGAANQTAASAQNTGFNPVNLAIGQPNAGTMANFGTGTFSNTNAGTQQANSSGALGFGNGVLSNMTSANNSLVGAASAANTANSTPAYLNATLGNL